MRTRRPFRAMAGAHRVSGHRFPSRSAASTSRTAAPGGASCSRSRDRATWWPSDTWIRATGRPISPAARASATRCSASILLSNLMAMLLQALALKLGIVTGRDLAQACRDHYSRRVSFALWVFCEIAIAACDLAEVIGSAIALNLLFGIPLIWGVVADVARRAADPGAAAEGIPPARGVHHRLDRDHRSLLRRGDRLLASGLRRDRGRARAAARRSSPIRRCCTSRSASSARR